MTVSKKITTIDHKIGQNKAQYDLDKQTVKISASYQDMLVNINF